MSDEIIVALIGLGGSCVGSLIGIIATQKLTQYRLQKLEEAVSKHNQLIDRTYKLEQEQSVIEEKISVANHRIDDLERRGAA